VTGTGSLHARGKVRDVYEAADDALILVATDRISAFDVVLPNPVPEKGRVLTGLSLFWFQRTQDLVANHLIGADRSQFPPPFDSDPELAGRAMLVHRASVIPVECVARGFLSGSGWSQYRESGQVCGIDLPSGLVESSRLPEPIFTPTTKAATGHDLALSPDEVVDLLGRGLAERLKELTLSIYERAASIALERGIILADTKFEFGFCEGDLILIDEVCTPDSSRFWPVAGYQPGRPQPSFDKQAVRDWLDSTGWDHEPPPPQLPPEIVSQTTARYVEAYETLTGERFGEYRRRMGIDPQDAGPNEGP
jgi:phosphoribosylaminoimidazole-succinocarboxamide synthase